MTIDRNAFIREGLSRYAEARNTISYFQTCVYDAIASAFEGKLDWKNFQPSRADGGLEPAKAIGSVFIHSYVAGSIPARGITDKTWLSLGVYWNAPHRPAGSIVAAAQCWADTKGTNVPFNLPPPGDIG